MVQSLFPKPLEQPKDRTLPHVRRIPDFIGYFQASWQIWASTPIQGVEPFKDNKLS